MTRDSRETRNSKPLREAAIAGLLSLLLGASLGADIGNDIYNGRVSSDQAEIVRLKHNIDTENFDKIKLPLNTPEDRANDLQKLSVAQATLEQDQTNEAHDRTVYTIAVLGGLASAAMGYYSTLGLAMVSKPE